jgi:hypothetical protein
LLLYDHVADIDADAEPDPPSRCALCQAALDLDRAAPTTLANSAKLRYLKTRLRKGKSSPQDIQHLDRIVTTLERALKELHTAMVK